jgi:neutral ceramidase
MHRGNRPSFHRAARVAMVILATGVLFVGFLPSRAGGGELRAGAAAVDVSPRTLPALCNGGFVEKTWDKVLDPLHARALVVDDGGRRMALVVVDSCMIPREVCNRAKALASKATAIPVERMLVSATHTHSAPSVMDYCLGTRADPSYTEFLPAKIAEVITEAAKRLAPAEVGWTSVDAPQHTHCRRWIVKPGKIGLDPFGERTIRAMMHPGYQNPDYAGPSGPVDSQLSLLSFRSLDGRPLALLANYSMHYFGIGGGFSADYFGQFCSLVERKLAAPNNASNSGRAPVVIMSQGTSGDLHWMDYSQPKRGTTIDQYADELAQIACEAYPRIEYRRETTIAMAQRTLTLGRRTPDAKRLEWARKLNAERGERRPATRPEVYAEQAVYLHEHPTEELVLQAVRIGQLGLTAIPNEVFSITGLKLKACSPLQPTFNIELANGASGYIPPPEQHALGGYTTWPARTAGLEVEAEPKIVEAMLSLLEEVSGRSRLTLDRDLYGPVIRARMQAVSSEPVR